MNAAEGGNVLILFADRLAADVDFDLARFARELLGRHLPALDKM